MVRSIPRVVSLAAVAGILVVAGMQPHPPQATAAQPPPENERVKKLFSDMRHGQYKEDQFPRLELADVPALLEYADSTRVLKSFPTNPLSSHLLFECKEGIVALWLVEGIRQGGKYPSLNAVCRKAGEKAQDEAAAAAADHRAAARAYRAWWEKARALPPEEAKKLDPLRGTDLRWY
jgi:hypothetical protein